MKELQEYRTALINRLVEAAHAFRSECLTARDVSTPLEPGGWTLHQIATHTRDVDRLVYGTRAYRTAQENHPEFPNFDGDAFIAEHYSASEPLEEILDQLVGHVENLAAMLRDLPTQAWARESSHAMLGQGLTLQSWVEKDLAHIEEHLAAIQNWKNVYSL